MSKNDKEPWRYHHLTQLYQKSWSYALLFLRYGMTNVIVIFHFELFFALIPPYQPKKWKFHKNGKKPWRYHLTQVCQKSWSYAVLFLRHGEWQMWLLFFILDYFLPFYPFFKSLKNQNLKKNEKNALKISSFYRSLL